MSAQDDVLAAFGELPWKVREREAEAEAEAGGESAEAAGGDSARGAAEAAGEGAEVGVGEQETGLEHGAAPEAQVTDGAKADAGAPASGERPSAPTAAQPYLDPASFFAELQAETAPPPKPSGRRRLLRYAAAVVLAGAVGAGTAYGVSVPRRTDLPFLGTPSDGRYTFPSAVRPGAPSGKPVPNDGSNTGQVHFGDLRQYLLPAPTGAVPKEDGWESVADFESSLSGSDVSGRLYDAGLRHVAWRGWSASDGQHTVIELLQFPDREAAFGVEDALDGASLAKAGAAESVVPEVTVRPFGDVTRTVAVHKFDQVTDLPGQIERRVVFASGDVIAIVTTTAPAKVPDLPTEQVAMLQAEMLR